MTDFTASPPRHPIPTYPSTPRHSSRSKSDSAYVTTTSLLPSLTPPPAGFSGAASGDDIPTIRTTPPPFDSLPNSPRFTSVCGTVIGPGTGTGTGTGSHGSPKSPIYSSVMMAAGSGFSSTASSPRMAVASSSSSSASSSAASSAQMSPLLTTIASSVSASSAGSSAPKPVRQASSPTSLPNLAIALTAIRKTASGSALPSPCTSPGVVPPCSPKASAAIQGMLAQLGIDKSSEVIGSSLFDRMVRQWLSDKDLHDQQMESLTERLQKHQSCSFEKCAALEAKLKQADTKIELAQRTKEALQEELTKTGAALDNAKAEISALNDDNLQLKKDNARIESTLKEKIEQLTKEIASLKKKSEHPGDKEIHAQGCGLTIRVEEERSPMEHALMEASKKAEQMSNACQLLEKKNAVHVSLNMELLKGLSQSKAEVDRLNKLLDTRAQQLKRALADLQQLQCSVTSSQQGEQEPPKGVMTIVCSSVAHCAELCTERSDALKVAITKQLEVMRCHLKQFAGYEVKRNGDSLTVAFQTSEQAVRWACAVQSALLICEWPALIPQTSFTKEERAPMNGILLFRGLRVKMGIHCGETFAIRNPMNNNHVEFIGSVVHKAQRLMACAQGGQVVMSEDVWMMINELGMITKSSEIVCTPLREVKLSENESPSKVFQALPAELADRRFPPLNVNAPAPFGSGDEEKVQGALSFIGEMMEQEWSSSKSRMEQGDALISLIQRLSGASRGAAPTVAIAK